MNVKNIRPLLWFRVHIKLYVSYGCFHPKNIFYIYAYVGQRPGRTITDHTCKHSNLQTTFISSLDPVLYFTKGDSTSNTTGYLHYSILALSESDSSSFSPQSSPALLTPHHGSPPHSFFLSFPPTYSSFSVYISV